MQYRIDLWLDDNLSFQFTKNIIFVDRLQNTKRTVNEMKIDRISFFLKKFYLNLHPLHKSYINF